jgi:hypothetical protein
MSRSEVQDVAAASEAIAAALREGSFDPQHAGELFLRADAARAVHAALGQDAKVVVAGKDEGQIHNVGFLGQRYSPDLVVHAGGQQVAVSITLLRSDASPITQALASALILSGRYSAVVAFILDRRLAKRSPFDDPNEIPAQRELTDAERTTIKQLWERHRIRVEVRRQDPFGW